MSLIIRPFEPADIAAANTLTNHYIRETAVHFASEPATDAQFEADWQATQPRFPWLAATVDGHFAGFAKAGPWRTRDAYRFTAETSVYIDSQFHGRGVGRALMTELLAQLSTAGFHTVIAGATLPNPGSEALHESLGFKKVAVFPQVGRKFDQWWDVGFWQLPLDTST